MSKALTAKSVEQIKSDPKKRREIPDGLLTGLYLVVQPTGGKAWAVRYRHAGQPRKLTLGPYPALELSDARDAGRQALQLVAKGKDPATEKRTARLEAAEGRDIFRNVVAEFIERHAKKNRSWPEVQRMFEHDVLPYWGDRNLQDITRRDVIALMDKLTDRGIGTMSNRVFSIIRKLFNWAISRDIVGASPCAGLRPPVAEVSRDRVLNDDETKKFWSAASGLGYPFGPLFKLLLLTGQRLSEVADMTASELRLGDKLWVIPKERAKNNTAHDVPLCDAALDIIGTLPRIAGRRGYVFTTTGETPVSGFSRAKANLDKAMTLDRAEPVLEWRLHDLRRTTATGMARLGINLPVIEKVLNHTSGSFAGIVGVYQRHSFAEEKRAALAAWGRYVTALVSGQTADNVLTLDRRPTR